MTEIEAHVAVACLEVLPVRLRECAVEGSKMEEGAVDLTRTIGGVVEIGKGTSSIG